MAGNNLQIINTGLDHLYLNGIPVVEAEINISDVFKKVARISSLAVQADPYFFKMGEAARLMSEAHGEGDRITTDFLKEGAKDILPIFAPFQRLIPEGTYDTTPVEYESSNDANTDYYWVNPDYSSIFINSILLKCTAGSSTLQISYDGSDLGTITLPEVTSSYLAYDLSGLLAGYNTSFTYQENLRNNNKVSFISITLIDPSDDFEWDAKVVGTKYDAIGWRKALTEIGDVHLPSYDDDIRISHLIKDFEWCNVNQLKVKGATIKHNCGGSYVTILYNGIPGETKYIRDNVRGDDYFNIPDDITTVSVQLYLPTDDFSYDLVINTELPSIIPSPRFEFDSSWNPGKIIFRYQNMDTRCSSDKLNYTSETLRDIRVDPNIFDEVLKYTEDSLKNYILKEWYEGIGYDKKAAEYSRKYENSRDQAKYWVRSEKGLQTGYTYAGV